MTPSAPLTNSERTALLVAVIVVGLWTWGLVWFTANIDPWLGNAILLSGALTAFGKRLSRVKAPETVRR